MGEEEKDEVSLSTSVLGRPFSLRGPIMLVLLAGWFGFAWVVYDGMKMMGTQHDAISQTTATVLQRENQERRREHEEITRQLAVLTCVLALPQQEKHDGDRFNLCIKQWQRAVLMLPG